MLSFELGSGAVLEAKAELSAPGRITGWAATGRVRTWAYLRCTSADDEIIDVTIAKFYNAEAAERNLAFGWCGFCVDLVHVPHKQLRDTISLACHLSGQIIAQFSADDFSDFAGFEDHAIQTVNVTRLMRGLTLKPAQLSDIAHLDLYASAFFEKRGAKTFVLTAYEYILGRRADPEGFLSYTERLKAGMRPVELLVTLFGCDEFAARGPVRLALPGDSDFPFYVSGS